MNDATSERLLSFNALQYCRLF